MVRNPKWARWGLTALSLMGSAYFFPAVILPVQAQAPLQPAPAADILARAREAYNGRRFSEAAQAYKEYLDNYPDGPDRDEAGFFYGHSLFLLRDYRAADEFFSREEGRNKKYADQIVFYRAEIAFLNRNFDLALIFYDRLRGEYPDSRLAEKARERSAEVHYRRGNQFVKKGAYSLALQDYLLAQDGPAELQPLAKYKLALCHLKLADSDRAIEIFGQLALDETPENRDPALVSRYRLARTLEDRARFAEAEVNFQLFLKSAPAHFLAPLVWEGLARVWAWQGKTDQALNYWREQGQGKDIAGLSLTYVSALDHYLHEEYADAERELAALFPQVSTQEFQWKVQVWLARTYARRGQINQAWTVWKQVFSDPLWLNDYLRLEYAGFVLPLDPDSTLAQARQVAENIEGPYLEEALRLIVLADKELHSPETMASATRYLSQFPQGRFAGEIAFLRGLLLFNQGDLKTAASDFVIALSKHPDLEKRLSAAQYLARIYQLQGRPDSALEVLAQAKALAGAADSPEKKLLRSEAEAYYGKGEYEKGIEKYEMICGGPETPPADLFRLFWGYYRLGQTDKAQTLLQKLAGQGSEEWKTRALFWQGVMALEKPDAKAALEFFQGALPRDEIEGGFWLWKTAETQQELGQPAEAVKNLNRLEKSASGSAIYVKGEIIRIAYKTNDLKIYLSGLPPAAEMDQELLEESALLNILRKKSSANARPEEIEPLNRALRLEALNESSEEEGNFYEARSKIYGPKRAEAFLMMDRLLARNPNTPFAAEIRFYHGEETYQNKDYPGTINWLKDIRPEQLPEKLRYRHLLMLGMSYKTMKNAEGTRTCFLLLVSNYLGREGSLAEWKEIGLTLLSLREFNAALQIFDFLLAGSSDPKLQAEIRYWKGIAQLGNGEPLAARETFLELARLYPDQNMWAATALYEAANISADLGEYDRALELYNQVLARTKGDPKTSAKVKAKIAEVKKLKSLAKSETKEPAKSETKPPDKPKPK